VLLEQPPPLPREGDRAAAVLGAAIVGSATADPRPVNNLALLRTVVT
jgi:hypothetical protein